LPLLGTQDVKNAPPWLWCSGTRLPKVGLTMYRWLRPYIYQECIWLKLPLSLQCCSRFGQLRNTPWMWAGKTQQ